MTEGSAQGTTTGARASALPRKLRSRRKPALGPSGAAGGPGTAPAGLGRGSGPRWRASCRSGPSGARAVAARRWARPCARNRRSSGCRAGPWRAGGRPGSPRESGPGADRSRRPPCRPPGAGPRGGRRPRRPRRGRRSGGRPPRGWPRPRRRRSIRRPRSSSRARALSAPGQPRPSRPGLRRSPRPSARGGRPPPSGRPRSRRRSAGSRRSGPGADHPVTGCGLGVPAFGRKRLRLDRAAPLEAGSAAQDEGAPIAVAAGTPAHAEAPPTVSGETPGRRRGRPRRSKVARGPPGRSDRPGSGDRGGRPGPAGDSAGRRPPG